MKSFVLFFVILLSGAYGALQAQGYRAELGAMGGLSSYMGDANAKFMHNTEPALSLLGRYHLNQRFSLKADLGYAAISGNTIGRSELYPNGKEISFRNNLLDATCQMEFNFYEYGAPDYKPGSSRISPYVTAGIGLLLFEKGEQWKTTACMPIGIGIKYKTPFRVNIGLELSYRMSFSDQLDNEASSTDFQLDTPWMGQSAWNKNNDHFAELKCFITYDLWYIGSNCYKE